MFQVDLPLYKLQLWPGYITSIRQHERDILLCAEITTKVMRSDTVYDILQDCYKENPSEFKKLFQEKVLGMMVYTNYNEKTYRIADVDFSKNPQSTFERKNKQISFVDYYKEKNQKIKDMGQPLLISKALDRQIRAGGPQLILLIPELCRVTGMSENMLKNFE